MTKSVKYILSISTLILVGSTVGLFYSEKLYSSIFWFISANTIVISFALTHIKKTNSNRLFGGYLIVFTLFYSYINYKPNWGIESIFYFDIAHLNYFSRTVLTLLLIGFGGGQLFRGGLFEQLKTKKVFWASIALFLLFLITEIPIYNIHPDFGGDLHGHNYLNGIHFH